MVDWVIFMKKKKKISGKSVLKDKEKMKKIEVKQEDFNKILIKLANKNKHFVVLMIFLCLP